MSVRFTNLRAFERDLKRFSKATRIAPETVAKRLQFEVFDGVVKRTPVDTGWARSNWQMARGARPEDNPVPKPAADTVLAAPLAKNPVMGPRPVYWVVNNVPYIVPLENGHSKQMGKGYMVRRTLTAVQANVRRLLKELL